MNFLQLCQRTARECGIPGTGPASVANQIEEAGRIVNWVNDAWLNLQSAREDWQWMRTSCSFQTVNGQAIYSTAECNAENFGYWARDTFRNYNTDAGINSEIFMSYLAYDDWRNSYSYGALRDTRTRPTQIAISPNKSICLGPYPSDGYTVTGDYYLKPSLMAADTDTPSLDDRFHMVLVWAAAMSYGAFESASEVYQRAELNHKGLMSRIEKNQTIPISFAGALA